MDYLAAMRRLGYADAQAHCHWPDFENCRQIVPLEDPAAVQLALARSANKLKTRLRASFGRALLRAGLFSRLVPCFSIVAQRGTSP